MQLSATVEAMDITDRQACTKTLRRRVAPVMVNTVSPAVGRRIRCLPICPEMLI
jgi:hypothetical protein